MKVVSEKTKAQQEKWSFDKDFLAAAITQGRIELESSNLSERARQSLRYDIGVFERFMWGDYELKNSNLYNVNLPKNIDKLKDYILLKMSKQYKMLGEKFIRWIMNLSEERIFNDSALDCKTTELALEQQVELIIKNYERNAPKFLIPAKEIILGESIRQIQLVDECSSYCHHDSITGQSYILINSTEAPCFFNHEVQHAIEVLLNYSTSPLYYELGPILYEMLFNEELYKLKGHLENGDFDFRIDDTATLLECVNDYFKVLISFAEKGFDVSTNEFITTFQSFKEMGLDSLEEYLREEIASGEILDDMNYVFSFLKAIELREKRMNSNNSQSELLEHHIKRKSFHFMIPQNGYKPYERYVEEMNQKVKKKVLINPKRTD